jgi:hypothetical protein
MLRTSALQVKSANQLVPGELVRVSFGAAAALALVLKRLPDDVILLGVIKSDAFTKPMTWYAGRLNDLCLSYGSDWIVEETHGPETACRSYFAQEEATLALYPNGLVMSFRAPERVGRYHFEHFNVEIDQQVDFNGNAAPISQWRMWESRDHFERGADPLFQMPHAE